MSEKATTWIFISAIWIIALTQIALTLGNRQVDKTSQTYARATNCLLAVPASERTFQYINDCYNKAVKATGITIERYGDE